jgi:hypothetical protein
MTFRTVACCAALLIPLFATMAQAACDGGTCPTGLSGKVGKPLQLGQFMRTAGKPTSRAVKSSAQATNLAKHTPKPLMHAVKTNSAKPKNSLALRKRLAPPDEAGTPLPTDAAAAFAAQHDPDVRVMAEDELNEIDLAAGPAAPETVGSAPSGEDAVRIVDATTYNEVDRQGDERSSPASSPDPVGKAAQSDDPSPTWIEQFRAMLRHAIAALTATWRALFG